MRLYKEESTMPCYITHFEVDVTEEMQELYGKEIIKQARVVSSNNKNYTVYCVDAFFDFCQRQWKEHRYVYFGDYDLITEFVNGKKFFQGKDRTLNRIFL